jgi:group I intron endonuclease
VNQNTGIYKIVNQIDGRYYVGSSCNIKERWSKHKRLLRQGNHTNDFLQRAWKKYGEDSFKFEIVESVVKSDLLIREQLYLNIAKENQATTYNLCFAANCSELSQYSIEKIRKKSTGRRHTEETKEKLRNIRRNQKFSEEDIRRRDEGTRRYVRENPNKHSQIIHTILSFKNKTTGEVFIGKRIEFIRKYNLNQTGVWKLVNGVNGTMEYKGWVLETPGGSTTIGTPTPLLSLTMTDSMPMAGLSQAF